LGAGGAATAAQQTYAARSVMVAPALGLASYPGCGQKKFYENIAQSIMQRILATNRYE